LFFNVLFDIDTVIINIPIKIILYGFSFIKDFFKKSGI
jgi:hypothetical protein